MVSMLAAYLSSGTTGLAMVTVIIVLLGADSLSSLARRRFAAAASADPSKRVNCIASAERFDAKAPGGIEKGVLYATISAVVFATRSSLLEMPYYSIVAVDGHRERLGLVSCLTVVTPQRHYRFRVRHPILLAHELQKRMSAS